jgi:peptidoglycan/LPS O-acetylase OafA/YrhL
MISRNSPKTTHRFILLDGLRGVAALFVLVGHTGSYWHFHLKGYLGADMFFILSGFVLAYAYDERLSRGELRLVDFVKLRIIRLYPFFALGAILGMADMIRAYHTDLPSALISLSATLFFLPSKAHDVPPYLFPVNPPYWTLLFELLANVCYAATRKYLTPRILIAALLTFLVLIAIGSLARGDLNYGFLWGVNGLFGVPRAFFGFGLGLLLFQKRALVARLGQIPAPGILAFVLLVALLSFNVPAKINGIADVLSVAVALPLIVALGAASQPNRFKPLLVMLGAASYPVYVLHVPTAGLIEGALRGLASRYAPLSGILFVCVFFPLCALAEQKIDLPLRKRLASQWLPKLLQKT